MSWFFILSCSHFCGVWFLFWSNGQVINIIPHVFPDPPSSYTELERVTASKTFTAPERGWFKFIALGESGDGGRYDYGRFTVSRNYAEGGGGGGGAGGIVVSSFALEKGETVPINITGTVSISYGNETMLAGVGGDGGDGSHDGHNGEHAYGGTAGRGGSATGGNIANQAGRYGTSGDSSISQERKGASALAGKGGKNTYEGYSTTGANGSEHNYTKAFVVILRGNTNIPLDVQNARDITANALAITALAQEQTTLLLQK